MVMTLEEAAAQTAHTNKPAYYLAIYHDYLSSLRDKNLAMLELGVHRGGSLEMWSKYFPKGRIVGIDQKPVFACDKAGKVIYDGQIPRPHTFENDQIIFRQGSQADKIFLEAVASEFAPDGWDLIIDDCSHVGKLSLESYKYLFPHLKKGGLYVLEDWCAGYMHDFPDGVPISLSDHFSMRNDGVFPVHRTGMPGLVKFYVDELGLPDSTRNNPEFPNEIKSSILYVHVYRGLCVIKKG